MTELRSQATKGVFWSFVERFSVQGVQFLIGIIMARLLSPHDYGLIGMLAIFMSLSQVFVDGGFSTALIQKKDRSNADYTTVFYINLVISILLYSVIFLCAPLIAKFFSQPVLTDVARVYCFNLIINSLAAVNRTKLLIAVDFKTQSKISLISAVLSGVVGIYFAYYGYAVWALVVQGIVSAVLNVGLSFFYVRWLPALLFSVESFHSLFKFGSKVLLATIISSVYTNLYNLAIGKKFNSADLGFYTRADQFTSLISKNITDIINRVSLPVLTNIQDDDKRLVNAYRKYIQAATFLVFPLTMGLCGISKPLILLLLTDKWADTIILMQILSFNYFLGPITTVNLNLLYVKGRSDLILRLEIFKKSIAFTILIVSLFFSLEIVCLGLVVYSVIATYLNCHYTDKLLNYGFVTQMKEILPNILLSMVVLAESFLLSEIISNSLLSIVVSLFVCSLSYISMAYLFKVEAFREIMEIVPIKLFKD